MSINHSSKRKNSQSIRRNESRRIRRRIENQTAEQISSRIYVNEREVNVKPERNNHFNENQTNIRLGLHEHELTSEVNISLLHHMRMIERMNRVTTSQRCNAQRQKHVINFVKRLQRKKIDRRTICCDRNKNERIFFDTIDEPLTFICASCGELANAAKIKVFKYDENHPFFLLLATTEGRGLIEEAIVKDQNGNDMIPLCKACYKKLENGETPKFSKAAGFLLGVIPDELARLNDMESRMVGIGVCFTTCFHLRGGGQLGTRGNSISYWNQTCSLVKKLPRPVSKCGVVYLRTNSQNAATMQIRPNYIRAALYWLIHNNPLYHSIQIDQELLQELEQAYILPELILSEDDVIDENLTHAPEENSTQSTVHTTQEEINEENINIENGNFIETFEMPTGDCDNQTETERMLSMLQSHSNATIETVSVPPLNVTINEYTNKHFLQTCFPTLFPNGLGGYNPIEGESRFETYHLAEYFAHLMMWHDRRFVIHPTFKFFALNLIQRRQVDGLTRKAARTENNVQHYENNREDQIKRLLQQLKPYFKSVRGTGLYWSQIRSELMAMLGSDTLPVQWPTFFFTLSAADTIWPDFFRSCNPELSFDEASTLPQAIRYKYLNEFPDIAARHFYRRYKAFFANIINGGHLPVGRVVDYFWRVEFQKRGSPHIHGLLWVEGSPNVLELCKTEYGRNQLVSYVDKYVYAQTKTSNDLHNCLCDICTETDDEHHRDILTRRPPTLSQDRECDLRRVVERVQQHICFPTSQCHQKKGTCRFEFPKRLREFTEIEVNQVSERIQRIKIHCKRNNPFVNNFNPEFILPWRANSDISLIGNAHGIAEYTASYISKAEPDTSRFRDAIRKALDKSSNASDSFSTLRRVANATIAVREVSAQEAMWILLPGLPMTQKSRSVVKVKTLRHHKRSQWISPEECLDLVDQETNIPEDQSPRLDSLERLYCNRPRTEYFMNMSYKYFCEHYEFSDAKPKNGQQLQRFLRHDRLGYIKERKQAHVLLKTPNIKPDTTNADYCFQELLLLLPWSDINDLPTTDNECISRFHSFRLNNTNVAENFQAFADREEALDLFASEETSLNIQTTQNDNSLDEQNNYMETTILFPQLHIPNSYCSTTSCTVDQYRIAENFICNITAQTAQNNNEDQGLHEVRPYMYPIGLDGLNMNDDQWTLFALCMQQSRRRKNSLETHTFCEQMKVILNGEGGSGKSWLINHIVKETYHVFGEHRHHRQLRILLMAHQGTAAFNINGSTICSSLAIPRSYSNSYTSLTNNNKSLQTLKRLQDKYENVHMIIIDEFSVLSCTLLYWIDLRLREIFPAFKDKPFGGRDIIIAGDVGQLNPVKATSLSTGKEHLHTSSERGGRTLWEEINLVCNLHAQNRGANDEEWYNALRRLRTMDETQEDIALFNTRVKSVSLQPSWIHNATHIAYTNKCVIETNDQCLAQQPHEIVTFNSLYEYTEKDPCNPTSITPHIMSELYNTVSEPNQKRDSVVQHKIQLALQVPVTLTYNVAQSVGLCNGTKGIIYGFLVCPSKQLPIVLVKITDKYTGPSFLNIPNIVPIPPKTISLNIKHDLLRVSRIGIPLRLAYGMTIHKVQGLTCFKIVFNPASIPSSNFAYVALSRVRSRDDIILTEPLVTHITRSQANEKKKLKKECDRLHQLAQATKIGTENLVLRMKDIAIMQNA